MFKELKSNVINKNAKIVFVSDLDLHDSYEALLNVLRNKELLVFDTFDYKLRDLNKRLIDVSIEAIVEKIIFIEAFSDNQLFKEELIEIEKYMNFYDEIETVMVRLPLLMDELYSRIVNEEKLPRKKFTVLSKEDIELVLEKIILLKDHRDENYDIKGISLAKLEDYYKAFDLDQVSSHTTYFEKYKLDVMTWESFVRNKKLM